MFSRIVNKIKVKAFLRGMEYARRMDGPPWLETALGEMRAGVRELRGGQHSQQVLAYLATCHKDVGGNLGDRGAGQDETPWCSGFVNWVMLRHGYEPTRSAAARSWEKWGADIMGEERRPGAIVVLSRAGGMHVAFDTGKYDPAGRWLLCGGNQSNKVSVDAYEASRVRACRWPK